MLLGGKLTASSGMTKTSRPRFGIFLLTLGFMFVQLLTRALAVEPPDPHRFDKEIAAFDEADRVSPPQPGGIVFVGSSSIRMWKTLATDFPGVAPINRGFGGSQTPDCVFYFESLVGRLKPRLVVYYCGGNDLAAGRKPEEVAADFRAFCAKLHTALPETRLIVCSIKLTPSRWNIREQTAFANTLLAAHCAGDPRRMFVDINSLVISPDGQPRSELYLEDRLHLNSSGYALWRSRLLPLVK